MSHSHQFTKLDPKLEELLVNPQENNSICDTGRDEKSRQGSFSSGIWEYESLGSPGSWTWGRGAQVLLFHDSHSPRTQAGRPGAEAGKLGHFMEPVAAKPCRWLWYEGPWIKHCGYQEMPSGCVTRKAQHRRQSARVDQGPHGVEDRSTWWGLWDMSDMRALIKTDL